MCCIGNVFIAQKRAHEGCRSIGSVVGVEFSLKESCKLVYRLQAYHSLGHGSFKSACVKGEFPEILCIDYKRVDSEKLRRGFYCRAHDYRLGNTDVFLKELAAVSRDRLCNSLAKNIGGKLPVFAGDDIKRLGIYLRALFNSAREKWHDLSKILSSDCVKNTVCVRDRVAYLVYLRKFKCFRACNKSVFACITQNIYCVLTSLIDKVCQCVYLFYKGELNIAQKEQMSYKTASDLSRSEYYTTHFILS